MSGFKGTPGPWRTHPKFRSVCAGDDRHNVVVEVPYWTTTDNNEQIANLALIAATPVLLAALEEIRDFAADSPDDHPLSHVFVLARSALMAAGVRSLP